MKCHRPQPPLVSRVCLATCVTPFDTPHLSPNTQHKQNSFEHEFVYYTGRLSLPRTRCKLAFTCVAQLLAAGKAALLLRQPPVKVEGEGRIT